MAKLDTRVNKAFGSVNLKDWDSTAIDQLSVVVETIFKNYVPLTDYFFIWHTETDTLHFHFLIFLSKQVRLSTIINYISDSMGISSLAVNIDMCRGVSLCLRYMLHIDDTSKIENKKIYNYNDFISNHDISYIDQLIQMDEEDEVTTQTLINLVIKYSSKVDIMYALGLKTYHKYRSEIKDMFDDKFHIMAKYCKEEE